MCHPFHPNCETEPTIPLLRKVSMDVFVAAQQYFTADMAKMHLPLTSLSDCAGRAPRAEHSMKKWAKNQVPVAHVFME